MCPITFLLLSCIVPLWYVGGDDGYGEEMMGMGRRWWVWGGDYGYGEEMMVWGGDDGYGEKMMVWGGDDGYEEEVITRW